MLKYTYEQVLSSQVEQFNSKRNNTVNLPDISKVLLKNNKICNISEEIRFM